MWEFTRVPRLSFHVWPFCPHFKTIPHPQLKVTFQYMKPKYGNQKDKKWFFSNWVKHTFTLSFVTGHVCVKDIPTHYWWISLGKLVANKRMHGTFYKDTTTIHCGLMARAHKVWTHLRNTSKVKLYWELNGMTVNSTTFMSSGILNLMPCTKFAAVP